MIQVTMKANNSCTVIQVGNGGEPKAMEVERKGEKGGVKGKGEL